MIEKLTPQQEAQIIPHRDFWLNYIFSCQNRTDREKAKAGIEWLYKFCKKEKPLMIFVDSPLGCQIAANYLKAFFSWDQVRAQVWDQVRAQVWDQVWAQVWAQVWDQVRAQVRAQVWDQVWDQVRAQVRDQVWDQVRAPVRAQVGDQDQMEYFPMSSYGNVGDFGWVAFLDYFLQLDIVKSDKKDDFNSFRNLLLSGVFDMIQLEGICIVSDMPALIIRDAENRLHNLNSEAILFKDGYGQHYIHGRYLPPQLFQSIKDKKFTSEQFFREKNEEVKSACIAMMQELYGEEYVFNFFREALSEVNTYIDQKDEKYLVGTTKGMNIGVYTLFKGKINGENVAYVRCYCPSTDRMFFLGVDPIYSTAKDAIASLYRVPKKLQKHIKYIQRQGERFSTVFDEVGTNMLRENKLSQSDISDTITIPGDKYFSLIKYEY